MTLTWGVSSIICASIKLKVPYVSRAVEADHQCNFGAFGSGCEMLVLEPLPRDRGRPELCCTVGPPLAFEFIM